MIYFIQEDGNSGAPIKIGYTSSKPEDRLASLQTGYPARLKILRAVQGRQQDEQAVHARWRELRLHGEWFRATPELLEYISALPADEFAPERGAVRLVPAPATSVGSTIKTPAEQAQALAAEWRRRRAVATLAALGGTPPWSEGVGGWNHHWVESSGTTKTCSGCGCVKFRCHCCTNGADRYSRWLATSHEWDEDKTTETMPVCDKSRPVPEWIRKETA